MRRHPLSLTLTLPFWLSSAHAETVRFNAPIYSPQTGPYFERLAADFHAANPAIDVRVELETWDNLLQALQKHIAGGTTPDLSIVATRWLLDFVRDNQAERLDPLMSQEFRGRFLGATLSPGQVEGVTYGLPIAASARALYYNKDLLAKAGVEGPPSTWEELVVDSRRLKAAGIVAFGLQGKQIETDVYWYYALWTHGGEVVGSDGKAAFASPAGEKSLALYKSLIDEGLTQGDVTNSARADLQTLFKQGRLAFVITTPALVAQIAAEVPTLSYGVAPVPRGTRNATYAVTDSVMLFKSSKVKVAAFKFLDFLFTRSPRLAFAKREGFLPTTKGEASDPYFTLNERLLTFIKLLPDARYAPTVTGWELTAKAVTEAVQSVYLGQAEPAAALRQAATRADAVLGR